MKETNRNNNFGMLHLAFAFFVMYGHQYDLLNQTAPVVLGNVVHTLGLKAIFLISGYLIAKSLFDMTENRKKIVSIYLVKRIGRLFPELFFCLMITALLIAPFFSVLSAGEYFYHADSILKYIRKNILLSPVFDLPGVFVNNPYSGAVNGSLWTMPIEFALYILFLLIMLPFKSRDRQKVMYAIVGSSIFILWSIKTLFFYDSRWIWYGTDWAAALNIAMYFMLGGAVRLWNLQNRFDLQKSFFLTLILCVLRFSHGIWGEIACMIALSCCVFSLGFVDIQSLNIKRIHPECAYGVYLWGFPVQQALISILMTTGTVWSINVLFCVSAVITYIFARISYTCAYEPFRKINSRIIKYIDTHF